MGNGLGNGFEGLKHWLAQCPPGTLVQVSELLATLGPLSADSSAKQARTEPGGRTEQDGATADPSPPTAGSWRERLWTAPPECRIGREELLEAVGRPRSWLYRHTKAKAKDRIPHRKLDGELIFVVGELREWVREHEEIVQAGTTDADGHSRLRVAK